MLEAFDLLIGRLNDSVKAREILEVYWQRTPFIETPARREITDRWVELGEWAKAVHAYEGVVNGTTEPDLRRSCFR